MYFYIKYFTKRSIKQMIPRFHDFPIQIIRHTYRKLWHERSYYSIHFDDICHGIDTLTKNGHSKQYVCTRCTCVPNRKNSRYPERQGR